MCRWRWGWSIGCRVVSWPCVCLRQWPTSGGASSANMHAVLDDCIPIAGFWQAGIFMRRVQLLPQQDFSCRWIQCKGLISQDFDTLSFSEASLRALLCPGDELLPVPIQFDAA